MAKQYWLMKCEPEAYSIRDLERDGTTIWEGVRNYQARNLMRDTIKKGDGVLFYASNAKPSGVSGLAEVVRAGYPDPFQFDPKHKYYAPKSDPEDPTWYAVDLGFKQAFDTVLPLATLKTTPGLEEMMVTKRGMRLSIQPVTKEEFAIVRKLGRS